MLNPHKMSIKDITESPPKGEQVLSNSRILRLLRMAFFHVSTKIDDGIKKRSLIKCYQNLWQSGLE